MRIEQKVYELLEKKIARKYGYRVVYGNMRNKGAVAYRNKLIIVPHPTSKPKLFIFFHEIAHILFEINREEIMNKKGKELMKNELDKLNFSRKRK